MKLSTVFRTAIAQQFDPFSTCNIYSGTIPSTGDTSPTGTLLVSFTTGLTMAVASADSISIAALPLTSDPAAATGTAGYAMLTDGAANVMYCSVGTSGAEVNLSSLSITAGETLNILTFAITVPGS